MNIRQPFASLDGRSAVVTGGAQGIGEAITRTLLDVGMHVLVVDRDSDALAQAEKIDARVSTVRCDITVEQDWPAVSDALADLPPLRAWINNAGVVSHQAAEAVDPAEFDRVMQVNARAVIRGAQVAHSHMTGAGPYAIVNVASMAVDKVLPERLSYASSKSAVVTLTRYLAQEWGPRGIRVNAVCPGYIDTRLTRWADDDPRHLAKLKTVGAMALPRTGDPSEIASAALFLISDLASYIAGDVVYVDGGWHLT